MEIFDHFARMIDNCYDFAAAARAAGQPIVGILCEFTPRELIRAAGALPVCLCGGSRATIAAAEEDLPAGLCPLIKSTYGYGKLKSNPFLEMADLIVAETTCDGKKKMYELLARRKEVIVLELPQKPDEPEAFAHWLAELGKLKAALERRFGVAITPERLREEIGVMNRERALRRGWAALMRQEEPPLTGRQLLDLKSSISGIPRDLEILEKGLNEIQNSQCQIINAQPSIKIEPNQKEKTKQKTGCCGNPDADFPSKIQNPKSKIKTRVLVTGVPIVHGAERVLEIIEGHGGLVVCQENCTGMKPLLEDVATDTDPLRALAQKYFHLGCSVMTPNRRRMAVLRQLAREYRPDCVIELVWQGCLTYAVEAHLVRELCREMGLPYLYIETDYAPADSARIALRIEALFETIGHNAL